MPARRCSRRCSSPCPCWPWGVPWAPCSRTIVAPVPPSSQDSRRTARLVVLVSGGGTNLQALIDATTATPDFGAEIVAVGADRDDIEGLARAERVGIPTFVVKPDDFDDRVDWDLELADAVAAHEPDLVVLAGFMRLVGPAFLGLFGGRTVNTHPSLLPSFPGMHAPRDAFEYGVKVTGATLIVVDDGVDTGPIIAQVPVAVLDDDDAESLHDRIKVSERAMLVEWVGRLVHEALDHLATSRPWPGTPAGSQNPEESS
jgi:phosphoribosylglycinamide formyltransferase 1